MDPISLLVAAGAALAGVGFFPQQKRDDSFRWRTLMRWEDGWIASELLSEEALCTVAASMNAPLLAHREPERCSGFKRFCLVTKENAPPSFAVVVVYDRIGRSVELAEAWGVSMTRPSKSEQWQHISELTQFLQRDIGRMVADLAMQIPEARQRYAFLKRAVRRPRLAAHIVPDLDFASVVVATTQQVAPDRLLEVAERPAAPLIGLNMEISPPPLFERVERALPGASGELPRRIAPHVSNPLAEQPTFDADASTPLMIERQMRQAGGPFRFDEDEAAEEMADADTLGAFEVVRAAPGFDDLVATLVETTSGNLGVIIHVEGEGDVVMLDPVTIGGPPRKIEKNVSPLATLKASRVNGKPTLEIYSTKNGLMGGLLTGKSGEMAKYTVLIEVPLISMAR